MSRQTPSTSCFLACVVLAASLPLLVTAASKSPPPRQQQQSPSPRSSSPPKPTGGSPSTGQTQAQQGNNQQQQQPQPNGQQLRMECADVAISATQLALATQADIVVTGVALAAGPGAGLCHENGTLTPRLDQAGEAASGTSFILLGLQCVHKGMIQCRPNDEDAGDCLILVETPVLPDSQPCALTGGQRYMFFLQSQTAGCPGLYLAMYERAYHTIRRPLGGTGCSFYPAFPAADDLTAKVNGACPSPARCPVDRCSPTVTRSPCANDTAVVCELKECEGKFMYYNAIMPADTCYELYTYRTSGLPVNCYGRRYISNRIREIELAQALANATAAGQDANSNKDKGGGGSNDDATLAALEGLLSQTGTQGDAEGN